MKALHELLALKQFREREAEREVMRQKTAVEQCEQIRHQCESALHAFRDYARKHELELYADLCSRMVVLGDIEDVQHAITRLREDEAAHAEALEHARAEEVEARKALDCACQDHVDAVRMTQKFNELVETGDRECAHTSALREEHELDEVGSLVHAHASANRAALMEIK